MPKCFRNFIPWTPTRALPWTHCKAYSNSRPAPAFHSIRRFNLCSKITHMWRKWGTSQNFFLAFYWWTWKTNSYQKNYRKGPAKNMLHFLKKYKEKSHTCQEGGAHLRLSFWHLLMNLKNKQILKKLLKWANKKQKNFNIYNVAFIFKKIKKDTCRYHSQNLDYMIYSSWYIEQNKLKLLILGHFLPFHPPENLKNQNFQKWKNLLEILSFYTSVPKITITWCTVPEIWS